jgi:Tol biopolymer transport system component
MPRIFISYRRNDSISITGRIHDKLIAQFGRRNVYMDVVSIDGGTDFRVELKRAASQCDVMLVIIGHHWLNAVGTDDKRRLDDPDDFVRLEVETGLGQKEITVIPILVSGATMPKEEKLPQSISNLAYQNALSVRENPDFDGDIKHLIRQLKEAPTRKQKVARPPRFNRQQRRIISIVGILILLGGILVYGFNSIFNPDRGINRFTQFTMPPIAPRPSRLVAMSSGWTGTSLLVDSDSGETVMELPNAFTPSFSPDGARLTYTTGNGRLYILNPYTGEGRQISDSGSHAFPIWSTDGRWIASLVQRAAARSFDLVITSTDIDDSVFTPPRELIGEDASPSMRWSPDGTQIAYKRLSDTTVPRIQIVDTTNPSSINLVEGFVLQDWSNAGLLVSARANNCYSVGIYDVGTLRYREIKDDLCFEEIVARWSPDGNTIAVSKVIGDDSIEPYAIGIVAVSTGEIRWLETVPSSSALMDWSKDGRYIMYLAGYGLENADEAVSSTIEIVDINTGRTRVLHTNLNNESFTFALWQP